MNTDATTDRVIAVDFGQTLGMMIAAGRYDRVNPYITADRFLVEGTGTKRFRAKVFDPRRYICSENAVSAMKAENFTPGSHIHGFAYGAAYPEEQRKNPIACLGSSAHVFGFRYVVYLDIGGVGRGLDLIDWLGDWDDLWRFLGIQEVSDT